MYTKKSKTWKIGECCTGGIIQAKVSQSAYFPSCTSVKIIVKEWKTGEIIHSDMFGRLHESRLDNHLNEMTTSYHASKIMEWIKENAWQHNVLVTMEGRN